MSSSRRSSQCQSGSDHGQDCHNIQADVPLDFANTVDPSSWTIQDLPSDQLFNDVGYNGTFSFGNVSQAYMPQENYSGPDPQYASFYHNFGLVPVEENYPVADNASVPLDQPLDQPFDQSVGQHQGLQSGDNVIDPQLLEPNPADGFNCQSTWGWQNGMAPVHTGPLYSAAPGLVALPGTGLNPGCGFSVPVYPDPTQVNLQPQPYNFSNWTTNYFPGNSPYNTSNMVAQPQVALNHDSLASVQRIPSEPSSHEAQPPRKRRRNQREVFDISDDSDTPSKPVKRRRKQVLEDDRRISNASSDSSEYVPLKPRLARTGEKPQKMEEKPWVRVNTNTKGETTRTARINNEAIEVRKYKDMPLPHGNWTSGEYTFEYACNSGVHEFKKLRMPARQIEEYIFNYPSDDLRLWIQAVPADAARRYASHNHSRCRFDECPKHQWNELGTIDVGHFRVAFDEKYKRYGNKIVDPYDCTGFVHLWCLEAFTDFAAVCKYADILVDTRTDFPRESGRAKFSLFNRPEVDVMDHFIKAAKKYESVRETEVFKDYPVHISADDYKPSDPMLITKVMDINIEQRTRSQMRQFLNRKLTPNNIMVNKGDLDLAMTDKRIKKTKWYTKAIKSKRYNAHTFDFSAYYDRYDPIINERIAEWIARKPEFDDRKPMGQGALKSKTKTLHRISLRKGKTHAYEEDDDGEVTELGTDGDSESEDLDAWDNQQRLPRIKGSRTSPRKRQRVNYAVDDDFGTINPVPQPQIPVNQSQQLEGYHNSHYTQSFPEGHPEPQPIEPGSIPTEGRRPSGMTGMFCSDILGQPLLNIDDYPIPEPDPTKPEKGVTLEEINRLLNRHKSSTLSNGPALDVKSRQASFDTQPVSNSVEFAKHDPPAKLSSASSTVNVSRRLSARLAAKAAETLASVGL